MSNNCDVVDELHRMIDYFGNASDPDHEFELVSECGICRDYRCAKCGFSKHTMRGEWVE